MWRGGLPPLGCEAAPAFLQSDSAGRFCDGFAAERGQAPSPQVQCKSQPTSARLSCQGMLRVIR
ncbi:hypothetical protein PspS34_17200 [Pseudomonas sp. S34]|nr:hypothetical protein PspS34_17200 [Pseudomonas sp. S34]